MESNIYIYKANIAHCHLSLFQRKWGQVNGCQALPIQKNLRGYDNILIVSGKFSYNLGVTENGFVSYFDRVLRSSNYSKTFVKGTLKRLKKSVHYRQVSFEYRFIFYEMLILDLAKCPLYTGCP